MLNAAMPNWNALHSANYWITTNMGRCADVKCCCFSASELLCLKWVSMRQRWVANGVVEGTG